MLTKALDLAASHHKGYNIYHSRAACCEVLEAVGAAAPLWLTPECRTFIHDATRVELFPGATGTLPIVVFEGLDGVGKSTTTTEVSNRIGGALIRTPSPTIDDTVRAAFRRQDEAISRAFYCAANYLAAATIVKEAASRPVVVDRWWASTLSMALALNPAVSSLPPREDPVYQWPADLPVPSLCFLLDCDEDIRRRRAEIRGNLQAEETTLASNAAIRQRAFRAILCVGGYEIVDSPLSLMSANVALSRIMNLPSMAAAPPAVMVTHAEMMHVMPF